MGSSLFGFHAFLTRPPGRRLSSLFTPRKQKMKLLPRSEENPEPKMVPRTKEEIIESCGILGNNTVPPDFDTNGPFTVFGPSPSAGGAGWGDAGAEDQGGEGGTGGQAAPVGPGEDGRGSSYGWRRRNSQVVRR